MEQAIHIAGKRAKVLLFGLGDPEENVSFNQFEAYTKELSIYTSYLNPHTSRKTISLLESGVIETKKIISARLSLEEMGEELKTKKYSRKGKSPEWETLRRIIYGYICNFSRFISNMWTMVVLWTNHKMFSLSINNCRLVGVFMGEPMTGMIAGATIQLIYLGWISRRYHAKEYAS